MKKFLKKTKYLAEYWLFLAVIKLLKLSDIDKSAEICSKIACKIGPFLRVTKIARNNIIAILGLNVNCNQIIDELWDNFGRFIGEFAHIDSMNEQEITERVEIQGLENIAEFQKENRPFLLFTGHFANWDFVLKVASKLYPKFGIVYRKANNPYVDIAIKKIRSDDNIHLIAKGPSGAKDLIKSIKSGYSIAMLVDQKMNDGIEVPFFGKKSMTPHAIAKFALQFDYPIIPFQIIRKKGSYFKVIIHSRLEFENTENTSNDCYNIMSKINQILESWIREKPGQWFWFHNRWKK